LRCERSEPRNHHPFLLLVEQASTSSTPDVVDTFGADVGGVAVVGGWSRRRPSLVPRSGLLDHQNRPDGG
jgi:hypothetical protein